MGCFSEIMEEHMSKLKGVIRLFLRKTPAELIELADWHSPHPLWPWGNILNNWAPICNLVRYWHTLLGGSILQGCSGNGILFVKMFWTFRSAAQLYEFIWLCSRCWNIFTHCRSRHFIIHSTFTEQTLIEFQRLWFMLALNRDPLSLTLEPKERNRAGDWRAGSTDELLWHVLRLAWLQQWTVCLLCHQGNVLSCYVMKTNEAKWQEKGEFIVLHGLHTLIFFFLLEEVAALLNSNSNLRKFNQRQKPLSHLILYMKEMWYRKVKRIK